MIRSAHWLHTAWRSLFRPCLAPHARPTRKAPPRRRLGIRPAIEHLEDRLTPSGTGLRDLYVMAHADDSLLFMNPDMQHSIAAGNAVETICTTAGDAGRGL